MTIEVLQKLGLQAGLQFMQPESAFPANPEIGAMVLKDKCIYAYLEVAGLETWYPFASRTEAYIHTQGGPASVWNITHNLGTRDVWYQVKDADGKIVVAPMIIVDENTVQIKLTYPMTGTCILVAPASLDVPAVKASVISVGGNDQVVINSSGVFVNGSAVLTSASIDQQIADAVAPKADKTYVDDQLTGKADKSTTYTKTEVDASIADIRGSGALPQGYGTISEIASQLQFDELQIADIETNLTVLQTDAVMKTSLGVANGVATLGSDGKVPSSQLPSYVDDVLEFADLASFPTTGETGKIYLAIDTMMTYRWSGSAYVKITSGEVTSVNGYKGVVVLSKTDIGLGNVENKDAATILGELTSSNVTTALGYTPIQPNAPITAGTATKITYDSRGIVTGGTTLSASDIPDLSTTYQPKNVELTGISAITGSTGLMKRTSAGNYVLDTNNYLVNNQTINVTGDATGSGSTAITLTLANSGVVAGTYNSSATSVIPFTVDAKGRITNIGTAVTITPAFSSITGKPTTLTGYGITDAVSVAALGVAGGVATLDAGGKIPSTQLPSTKYVKTFNVTTDWGTASGGFYTITVTAATHGNGSNPVPALYELVGGKYKPTIADISIATNGDVTISVADAPDDRFAGKLIIM